MPVEPNKKAEELLRAYSRKRRADAAGVGEMPGVTRNLLQAEVRKQFPGEQGRGGTRLGSLRVLWLRLALGSSVLAVIAFGLFLIVNPPNSQRKEMVVAATHLEDQHRLSETLSREPTVSGVIPPQASAPAGKVIRDPSVAASRAPTLAKDEIANSNLRRDQSAPSERSLSLGVVALPTNAVGLSVSRANLPALNEVSNRRSYRFTEVPLALQEKAESTANATKNRALDAAGGGQRVNKMLVNFSVETAGDQIRIVDSDGSVYTGRIGALAFTGEVTDLKKPTASLINSKATSDDGKFWAKGTNLTTHKEVSLAGKLQTNPLTPVALLGSQKAPPRAKTAAVEPAQRRAELHGVARIGTNEFRISAISPPPP